MNLADYLPSAGVMTKVADQDKWSLLKVLVNQLADAGCFDDQTATREEILAAVRSREETQSTGIGRGIGIPHARIPGYRGMTVGLATLQRPIPFDALDGRPVNLVWIILVAEEEPTLALQAYAKIQELMQDDAVRAYFESCDEPQAIVNYIAQRRIPVGGILTARDVMRPPLTHILPEMPLRDVVHAMRRHHLEAVAVEDRDRRLLGQITCDRLFQYGIPDFFNQLQSVGFISRFDPFEKYFAEEARAVARDLMETDYSSLPPDATMLEVVFALTVQRHPIVHVVEEAQRIGTIDRTEVLDRILDF